MQNLLKSFLLTACLFILAGCGFHLRGEMPLAPPLKNLYIQTKDPYGQLTKNLEQYLKMSGAKLARTSKEADTILVILNEHEEQNLQSVSGTQQTRQYNLILTVSFEVNDPNGQTLIPSQSVSESRPLTIPANQILGGSNEQATLYKQMRRAIVFDVMSRLSSQEVAEALSKMPKKKQQP